MNAVDLPPRARSLLLDCSIEYPCELLIPPLSLFEISRLKASTTLSVELVDATERELHYALRGDLWSEGVLRSRVQVASLGRALIVRSPTTTPYHQKRYPMLTTTSDAQLPLTLSCGVLTLSLGELLTLTPGSEFMLHTPTPGEGALLLGGEEIARVAFYYEGEGLKVVVKTLLTSLEVEADAAEK